MAEINAGATGTPRQMSTREQILMSALLGVDEWLKEIEADNPYPREERQFRYVYQSAIDALRSQIMSAITLAEQEQDP
jgi:hypothetical protein